MNTQKPKILKIKAYNMKSKNNNYIPNQFIIETETATYFQSYNHIIAVKQKNKVYIDRNKWDYSCTTSKYRNIFLNETKKETQRKINTGEYILTDLNK